MVDTCAAAVFAAGVVFPAANVTKWLDMIGSVVVAIYLIWCGVQTILESTFQDKVQT